MSSINDEWFIIKDLDGFIEASRALVFNNFGTNQKEGIDPLALSVSDLDQDELDSVLSYDETKNIIVDLLRKQTNKRNQKIRYLLNNDLYMKIISAIGDRMTSNILNSLVNRGLVETAYDENADDFIFWVKENENDKPETD
jgi:hypothetical protein